MKKAVKKQKTLKEVLPYILIVGSIIGLIASFVIMHDKLKIAANPSYQPACSLNPVISCGSVMASDQGSAFGFPNPIIGLIGYGVVITVGMALKAGAAFKRWFWLGLEAGTIFGVLFVSWLQFETIYRIQAICLYCVAVWIVTIPMFIYTTLYNLREGHIKTPANLKKAAAFAQKHHGDILGTWYLIIFLLILTHFWYYWSTLI